MSHDPEERCGPGTGGPEPDPAVDEFDRIVAGWRAEGEVPQWPTATDPVTATDEPTPPVGTPPVTPDTRTDPDTHLDGDARFDDWEARFAATPPPTEPEAPTKPSPVVPGAEDEHFVPPEPPPLPRLGPPAAVGLVLLSLGLLLVIAPDVIGLSSVYGLPLGLLALASGLGWLVLRLWPTAEDLYGGNDEDDDGAVL